MSFQEARCPACHQDIQVPSGAAQAICMYCGHRMTLAGSASRPMVANLLGMARTADAANNMEEAGGYYNRVLEMDPTLSEAWFGKGRCAGWQSTIVAMRFGEVQVAFQHAIATATASEKREIIQKCVLEINTLVASLYGMSRKHMKEYVALPKTWTAHLEQTAQMLDALDVAKQWLPGDRTTLDNIVVLCSENIEGVTFRDQFDNNNSKAWHLSPDYEKVMRQRLQVAVDAIKEMDPSYADPSPKAQKPDSCFVITATMGDFHHPTVTLLRQFRDTWILKRPNGPGFVAWYYRHGPALAAFIAKSPRRRRASYILIVVPATWCARVLMRRIR